MAIWSPPRPSTTGSGGLDRYFHVTERGSTIRTEVIAGAATWLTMAYIIFVNPAIIGSIPDRLGNIVAGGTQFDAAQVAAVTALVAGVLTLLMGAYANYPFAMAAGLGLNAFVTFTLVGTFHLTWPQAMGVIVWEGLCISVLVLTRFREYVMNAIPLDLKRAIGVGIGAFIAFIGLRNAGIVVKSDATLVTLNPNFKDLHILVFVIGLAITMALVARKVKGALLGSIVITTIIASIINVGFAHSKLYAKGIASLPSKIVSTPDPWDHGELLAESQRGRDRDGDRAGGLGHAFRLLRHNGNRGRHRRRGRAPRQQGQPARHPAGPARGLTGSCRRWRSVGLLEHHVHRERGGRLGRWPDRLDLSGDRVAVLRRAVPCVARRNNSERGDGTCPDHGGLLHDDHRQGHELGGPGHRDPGAPDHPGSASHVQHHERRGCWLHRVHGDQAPPGEVEGCAPTDAARLGHLWVVLLARAPRLTEANGGGASWRPLWCAPTCPRDVIR